MLYLDYSRKQGEWIPNEKGGRENLEAVDFLQRMNAAVYGAHPGVMTIAEESTSWPKVSQPVHEGGLGFGFKWNMGFMHDTLEYFAQEPIHRKHHHDEITFGLIYAFSENFVLPLSHDEVVHGKGTLIGKMAGDDWQKFATLRAYYAFMWGYPGKKLLFMGQEFAQRREWSEAEALDWDLLEYAPHSGVQTARARPQLPLPVAAGAARARLRAGGLRLADRRRSGEFGLCLGAQGAGPRSDRRRHRNFTPVPREGYRVPLPKAGKWREVINTDATDYGGSGKGNDGAVVARRRKTEERQATMLLAAACRRSCWNLSGD